MKLEDYKRNSSNTFQSIADNVKMERSTIFRIIRTPWRTTLESYLLVASYLGMPEVDAKREWMNSKIKYYQNKMSGKINQIKAARYE